METALTEKLFSCPSTAQSTDLLRGVRRDPWAAEVEAQRELHTVKEASMQRQQREQRLIMQAQREAAAAKVQRTLARQKSAIEGRRNTVQGTTWEHENV